jgi:hypothetical protein
MFSRPRTAEVLISPAFPVSPPTPYHRAPAPPSAKSPDLSLTSAGSPGRAAIGDAAEDGSLCATGSPEWAHLDLNQGPHPYQGCALTELSYGPRLIVKE